MFGGGASSTGRALIGRALLRRRGLKPLDSVQLNKEESNRNYSCLCQPISPVGAGTNQKSSSDITDDITGEGKVFIIAGAVSLLAVLPVAKQQRDSAAARTNAPDAVMSKLQPIRTAGLSGVSRVKGNAEEANRREAES